MRKNICSEIAREYPGLLKFLFQGCLMELKLKLKVKMNLKRSQNLEDCGNILVIKQKKRYLFDLIDFTGILTCLFLPY